ncbi:MAG: hypothetical protein R2910_05550 [Gemmatimonadales bacterium]
MAHTVARIRAGAVLGLIASIAVSNNAMAQKNSVSFEAGVVEYDAGADETYPLFILRGGREVLPWLRIGVGLSMASIGEVPRGPEFEPNGSETLWRGYLTAVAVSNRPFAHSGIAVIDLISPEAGIGIGVVHSAGLTVNTDALSDPYSGIEDKPTGFAIGFTLGLGVELSPKVSLRATGGYWSDDLYGGALDDFELTGGVQLHF